MNNTPDIVFQITSITQNYEQGKVSNVTVSYNAESDSSYGFNKFARLNGSVTMSAEQYQEDTSESAVIQKVRDIIGHGLIGRYPKQQAE
ncbi:hypothetical protein AB1L05_21920 [Cytobacillus horneckiae]|uniref:hypothetical protein n=1 Tax=Cytobacillus horneckiae TaxID=549687 RepID=UPI0039A021A4